MSPVLEHTCHDDCRSRLGVIGAARAQSTSTKTFGELKQIEAGVLSVGYAELGPVGGPAV